MNGVVINVIRAARAPRVFNFVDYYHGFFALKNTVEVLEIQENALADLAGRLDEAFRSG